MIEGHGGYNRSRMRFLRHSFDSSKIELITIQVDAEGFPMLLIYMDRGQFPIAAYTIQDTKFFHPDLQSNKKVLSEIHYLFMEVARDALDDVFCSSPSIGTILDKAEPIIITMEDLHDVIMEDAELSEKYNLLIAENQIENELGQLGGIETSEKTYLAANINVEALAPIKAVVKVNFSETDSKEAQVLEGMFWIEALYNSETVLYNIFSFTGAKHINEHGKFIPQDNISTNIIANIIETALGNKVHIKSVKLHINK